MNVSRTKKLARLFQTRDRSRLHSLCLTHRIAMVLLVALVCGLSIPARGQAAPTASRPGDLQIGGGFTFGNSTYNFNQSTLKGGNIYATFARSTYWGGEADFNLFTDSNDSTVYEQSYEVGPRIFLTRGRLIPYGKILIGRGVYNYSNNVANIAYNLYTYGGGIDYTLTPTINLRADYEYQNWLGFPLGTLHPSLVTIGAAFHFRK